MVKKKEILIWTLIAITIFICVIAGTVYSKNIQLKKQNYALETILDDVRELKNQAVDDMEQCQTDKEILLTELIMLNEDISKIKKGCVEDNACKGHFPDVRWICNVNGDAVNNGDKICVCDANCNLHIS
jgi:hypothetical protein